MAEELNGLLKQIQNYSPYNEQEKKDRELFLRWLNTGEDVLTRGNETEHLTASAWIVSPDRSQVLMIYHNIYQSWSWLGGHADGCADLKATALKEVREESGLTDVHFLSDDIFSIELLSVDGHRKRGSYVATHLHLNVTYLMEADPKCPVRPKPDENSGVQWIAVSDIAHRSSEKWFVEHVYSKLCQKVRDMETHL